MNRRYVSLAVAATLACGIPVGAMAGVVIPSSQASSNSPLKAVPVPDSGTPQPVSGASTQTTNPSSSTNPQSQVAQQQQTSMDGGTGLYFLPPLPGRPAYVRPGVDSAYQQQSPLSVKEIEWLKHQMAASQYAMHKGSPLTIQNPTLPVSMGPGSAVPVVHVARGYVTTLSVVGIDGNPWPITSYVVGGGSEAGAAIFNVQAPANIENNHAQAQATSKKDTGKPVKASLPSNMLTLSPSYYGASSNMVITLLGKSTPIMVDIISDSPTSKTVYGMVTLRVNRNGPNTPPAVMQAPPPSPVQSDLMLFMEQTPPHGSVTMKASGGYGVKAWDWNGNTIVRSRIPLAMPAWTAEIQQNGARVYQVPMTTQLLIRTDTGMKNIRLRRASNNMENPDANYLISAPVVAKSPEAAPAPKQVQVKAPPLVKLMGNNNG